LLIAFGKNDLIPGTKGTEPKVPANLGALMTLCTLTLLISVVRFGRQTHQAGQMRDHARPHPHAGFSLGRELLGTGQIIQANNVAYKGLGMAVSFSLATIYYVGESAQSAS
jgi:hypothetical protein